jgi:mono/diheme cytochrome c family protein
MIGTTRIYAVTVALVALLTTGTVLSAPVDEDLPLRAVSANRQIEYGKELYQSKARCISCHGWAGDGMGAAHSAGDAANLRKSKLDHAQLVQIISCGIPGTAMPHFNAFAYSEDKCYDMLELEVGANIPPKPPRPLQQREIEVLINYLTARIIGRGTPTRAECAEFYGDSPVCEEYAATNVGGH